jgi:thermostable 8-oxoguanine DNA glycosylase
MIDPYKIDEHLYELSDPELEWWAMFCVAVAGKRADRTKAMMCVLHEALGSHLSPFEGVRRAYEDVRLVHIMREVRTGQYKRLWGAWTALALRDEDSSWLRTCTVPELEDIYGIGPKTARFFVMSTRPGVRHAALDVHILRWLAACGMPNVPRQTPRGKEYARLEGEFLRLADEQGVDPAELDARIWLAGARGDT